MIRQILPARSRKKRAPRLHDALWVTVQPPDYDYGRKMTLKFALKPPRTVPEFAAAILRGLRRKGAI